VYQIINLSLAQYSVIQDAVSTELEKANSKLSCLQNETPPNMSFPPEREEVRKRIEILKDLQYKLGHPVGNIA